VGFAWSGIVSSHIHGPKTKAGSALRELLAVIGAVQAALSFAEVEALRAGLALPLDFAETEAGAREVENVLGRIEYGVYS
jgi:uncharacterized protein (DUF2384 family)